MAISFSVNCERAVLFPVKCDLDPPFTTLKIERSSHTVLVYSTTSKIQFLRYRVNTVLILYNQSKGKE